MCNECDMPDHICDCDVRPRMDRRSFLKTGAAGTAAASLAAIPAPPASLLNFDGVDRKTYGGGGQEVQPTPLQRVYVLGGRPGGGKVDATIRQMCDNVFERLIHELEAESCQYYVTMGEKIGHVERFRTSNRDVYQSMTLEHNYHTSYYVSMVDASSHAFPLDDFIEQTSRWYDGFKLHGETPEKSLSVAEAFTRGRTKGVVGMPALPSGVAYAAHYVDTVTGVVMRAIAVYEVQYDGVTMRFDVLVG